jgi:hypothetical protein
LNKPAALKWLDILLIVVAAVFLTGLFATELADTDAWWHLATGRYIVENHKLPIPDPFAYTTAGAKPGYHGEETTRDFNLTHEWLAQVAMYLIDAGGGAPFGPGAVVLWKSLLLALLCLTAGHVARLRTGSMLWGIAAALAAASLAVEFAHDRPSILSYVFTAVFIAIFEERRRLWLLPVLALVWANCHGGFFLGWIVCGAYTAEGLFRRSPDRKRIMAASAAALAASFLNPNGWAVLGTLLRYRQSVLTGTLIEWSRADLWGPPWAFDILLYSAALILVVSWRRVRVSDWLLFAAFAAAAVSAFRNEMLIGFLAPILIASYFPWKRALPVAVTHAAAAALVVATVWGAAAGRFFQLRAAEWRFPAGAAEFLNRNGIAGPLFNTYEYGGYLIWRGQRVFIDGRALSETVFQDYRLILGTPPGDPRRNQTLERYGVRAIVVNAFEYNSGVLYPLVLALAGAEEADWNLVYEDPQSLVFLRGSDRPAGPFLDKRLIGQHLEAECRLHIERDPEFSLCARTLANLYMRAGNTASARRMLEMYLAHPYADDPEARRAYLEILRH